MKIKQTLWIMLLLIHLNRARHIDRQDDEDSIQYLDEEDDLEYIEEYDYDSYEDSGNEYISFPPLSNESSEEAQFIPPPPKKEAFNPPPPLFKQHIPLNGLKKNILPIDFVSPTFSKDIPPKNNFIPLPPIRHKGIPPAPIRGNNFAPNNGFVPQPPHKKILAPPKGGFLPPPPKRFFPQKTSFKSPISPPISLNRPVAFHPPTSFKTTPNSIVPPPPFKREIRNPFPSPNPNFKDTFDPIQSPPNRIKKDSNNYIPPPAIQLTEPAKPNYLPPSSPPAPTKIPSYKDRTQSPIVVTSSLPPRVPPTSSQSPAIPPGQGFLPGQGPTVSPGQGFLPGQDPTVSPGQGFLSGPTTAPGSTTSPDFSFNFVDTNLQSDSSPPGFFDNPLPIRSTPQSFPSIPVFPSSTDAPDQPVRIPRQISTEPDIPILTYVYNTPFGDDQSWNYAYSTANGIRQEAEGQLRAVANGPQVMVMRGSYSYIGPDGNLYQVDWFADETGFHPTVPFLQNSPAGVNLRTQRDTLNVQDDEIRTLASLVSSFNDDN